MRNFFIDLYGYIFEQSGFSWREWRTLCKEARGDDFKFPDNWDGQW